MAFGLAIKCLWKGEKNDTKSKYPTTKFDCYDSLKDRIVEVKGCSIPNDLTSWSPKPYFDVFYFVDMLVFFFVLWMSFSVSSDWRGIDCSLLDRGWAWFLWASFDLKSLSVAPYPNDKKQPAKTGPNQNLESFFDSSSCFIKASPDEPVGLNI